MATTGKTRLVKILMDKFGMTRRTAGSVIDELSLAIADALIKGDPATVHGIGTIKVVQTKRRKVAAKGKTFDTNGLSTQFRPSEALSKALSSKEPKTDVLADFLKELGD